MKAQLSIETAAILDDFLDEEVVDRTGLAVGTLECYWESNDGILVLLGVKLNGEDSTRVVPGRGAHVDDRHSCTRLGFSSSQVRSAPVFDCAKPLDAKLESAVYKHYKVEEASAHDELRHFSSQSRR
jgi:hypothetical protein